MDIPTINVDNFYSSQSPPRLKRCPRVRRRKHGLISAANPLHASNDVVDDIDLRTGEFIKFETCQDIKNQFSLQDLSSSTNFRATWKFRTLLALHKRLNSNSRHNRPTDTVGNMSSAARKFAASTRQERQNILKRMRDAMQRGRRSKKLCLALSRCRKRYAQIIKSKNVKQFVLHFFRFPFVSYIGKFRSSLPFFFPLDCSYIFLCLFVTYIWRSIFFTLS